MQVMYTMFTSNNPASFHLWWKENLVKHQKVSKYYQNYCRFTLAEDPGETYIILDTIDSFMREIPII